jgi:hypothetical protein
MYKYLHLIGCKISSFFNYIFEGLKIKQKKYKKHDNDEDDIICYDNVYDNNSENVIYMSLIDA